MKEFNDDVFIVINKKRFSEMDAEQALFCVPRLLDAISDFTRDYEKATGKKMNQKYLVCNQDEPYAEQVKNIILGKKDKKGV